MADEDVSDESESVGSGTPTDSLRSLHRLAGAVALGAFLVLHLVVQGSALGGGTRYDAIAGAIARSPITIVFELVFVALPLIVHAGLGIQLVRRANTPQDEIDRYGGLRPWIAQRISAVAIAVFVCLHLWEFRIQRLFFGLSEEALYTTLTAHLSWTSAGVPWIALGYLVGTFAAALHLSNGLFAATATWNVATTHEGRKRVRILTVGLGVVLFILGATTVVGIATGTRLLPGADGDSAAPGAPCGSDAPAAPPIFSAPSR